jgi:hypothetical protein
MQEKSSATGLNQLLKILAENQIDFIVIGGFAGVLYGSSMVTHFWGRQTRTSTSVNWSRIRFASVPVKSSWTAGF